MAIANGFRRISLREEMSDRWVWWILHPENDQITQ
jgi:hypothetical protein